MFGNVSYRIEMCALMFGPIGGVTKGLCTAAMLTHIRTFTSVRS